MPLSDLGVELDRERSELRGPTPRLRELIAGGAPPEALDPLRLEADAPLLAAALTAARSPVARWTVSGLDQPLEGSADQRAAALLVALDAERSAFRGCTPSGLLGLLVGAVGLGPRPRHADDPPLRLPAERMALLLGVRSAQAAGLPEAEAERLQPHLDAIERHWRIEVRRADGRSGGTHAAGWYLEVVDGPLGLWTVEDAVEGVTLRPTDASAVLDELAALPGRVGLGREA